MKVRDLSNRLELVLNSQTDTVNALTRISHWVNKLRLHPEDLYTTDDPKEIKALTNLASFGVVEIKKKGSRMSVMLTKDGRELYADFFNMGYYGNKSLITRL